MNIILHEVQEKRHERNRLTNQPEKIRSLQYNKQLLFAQPRFKIIDSFPADNYFFVGCRRKV